MAIVAGGSVEQFIRSKYDRKVYISKDPPTVSMATESRSSPHPHWEGQEERTDSGAEGAGQRSSLTS